MSKSINPERSIYYALLDPRGDPLKVLKLINLEWILIHNPKIYWDTTFNLYYSLITPSDKVEYWWTDEFFNFTARVSCNHNCLPSAKEAYHVTNSFIEYLYGTERIKNIIDEPDSDIAFCVST